MLLQKALLTKLNQTKLTVHGDIIHKNDQGVTILGWTELQIVIFLDHLLSPDLKLLKSYFIWQAFKVITFGVDELPTPFLRTFDTFVGTDPFKEIIG